MRNEMSGAAGAVLQAGTISGGVHLHAASSPLTTVVSARISEWNPFDLDIHRAIAVSEQRLPVLPGYVRRDHDDQLDAHLSDLSKSVMVVLTAESSTGKTRALYEAVANHQTLRDHPLLYPRTAEDLVRMLEQGFPRPAILWLNEAHNHLYGPAGEAAAAGMRTLLNGPEPVVVLGTLWPQYWAELITKPPGGHRDEHAQARALLQHVVRRVRVADQFTVEQLASLRADRSVDLRLVIAAAGCGPNRQVIQTVAGGPALVERYEHPDHTDDRYASAIITVAIDARRLGFQGLLTRAFLSDAAGGYLTEGDRVDPPDDWFTRGLSRAVGDSMHGITALIPTRTRPGPGPADGYDLHDYLEQHGSTSRRYQPVPATLWDAFLSHVDDPENLWRLASAAYRRLLYRYADPLYCRWKQVGTQERKRDFIDVLALCGRMDEALVLLETVNDLVDHDASRYVIKQMLDDGRRADAVTLLRGYVDAGAGTSWGGEQLIDLLIDLGHTDEAVQLLWRLAEHEDDRGLEERWHDFNKPPWASTRLAELLASTNQIDELRQFASSGNQQACRRLADLLADQGDWEPALQLVRGGSRWVGYWLAQRLAAADRVDLLRRLSQLGFEIDEPMVEALLQRGQVQEALERLPRLSTTSPEYAPSTRLIDLLIQHNQIQPLIELITGPRLTDFEPSLRQVVDRMNHHGHGRQIVPLLDQLAGADSAISYRLRPVAQELLADYLAGRGRWDEVLVPPQATLGR